MNIQNTKPRLPSSISLAILLERTRTSHLPIHHLAEQKKTAGLIAVSISEPKTMLLSPSVCCYMQTAPSSPSHVESTPMAVPKDKPGRTLLLLKCSAKILHCLCCEWASSKDWAEPVTCGILLLGCRMQNLAGSLSYQCVRFNPDRCRQDTQSSSRLIEIGRSEVRANGYVLRVLW